MEPDNAIDYAHTASIHTDQNPFLAAAAELGEDVDMTDASHPADVNVNPTGDESDGDEEMDDLFGDAPAEGAETHPNALENEQSSRAASSPTPDGFSDDGLSNSQKRRRKALEYAEDDGEQAKVQTIAEAQVPLTNIPLPRTSDSNHWVIRMPNFVKLDSQPFSQETYRGPESELDPTEQAETIRERSMSIKLEVENTVRWRWVNGEDGSQKPQSNSRLIRWSDGSMSLQLGKELFDVTVSVDASATAPRAGGPANLPQPTPSKITLPPLATNDPTRYFPTTPVPPIGLTYLVAQHKHAGLLQTEASVAGTLTLRPTGMQSETHRKLVRAVGQKHSKVARLRIAAPEDVLSSSAKSGNAGAKRRTTRGNDNAEDAAIVAKKRRTGGRGSSGGMKSRANREVMYSDDDSDGDLPHGRGGGGGVSDDEDRAMGMRKRGGFGQPKATKERGGEYEPDDFVVSDEDEEDEDTSRRHGRDDDDEGEPDDLERMEMQLENQARSERKKPGGGGRGSDMDVSDDDAGGELEEEEHEAPEPTKRPAPARRRVVIEDDDDDE